LIGLVLGAWLFSSRALQAPWNAWEWGQLLCGWVGLFLPFAAFAGGLAVPSSTPNWAVTTRSLLVALISFICLAYGEPLARYQHLSERGADISQQFPLGPLTPGTLRSLKAAVEASPPETYRLSTDSPFEWPPNWVEHLLHGLFVLPLFSVVSALLGRQVRFLTMGLSPPARRNARWALGVLSGVAFFIPMVLWDAWVGNDPSRSGILGAWGPLSVPMLELGLLLWLSRHRASGRENLPVSTAK
jgi:hypothetical protein